MTTKNPTRLWLVPALFAAVLACLFWRSFLPGFVHFNNDGPLGMLSSAWLQFPESLTGQWYDLNSIGSNAGSSAPDFLSLIRWVSGPVGCAKFIAPIALWILGVSAWFFFRQLKLSPLAAFLGGIAAALNTTFFSGACWGVASQQIAIGMDFFALGLIVANTSETPWLTRWARLALAGICVGVNVMEAADIGAIFSIFIALYVFYLAFSKELVWTRTEHIVVWIAGNLGLVLWLIVILFAGYGTDYYLRSKLMVLLFVVPACILNWAMATRYQLANRLAHSAMRVAAVAIFAGFIAMQTVMALIGSSITGISGTTQDAETKAAHWDWATQWSLPKAETLSILVPGLFGYKMDTPNGMMPALQDAYKGGQYWGGVGRDPAIDRYLDGGRQGAQPPGFIRYTGGGDYAGILVVLIAAWAVAQSFRRENSVFSKLQKRFIWFWTAVLIVSLLLGWGRFAGFYQFVYMLPYASTIRNPTKFILVFSWAIVILFSYGVHALSRRYLEVPAGGPSPPVAQFKNWWAKVKGFDRNWTFGCGAVFIISVLAWLIYSSQKPALVRYLQMVGFPDAGAAREIAAFSFSQVAWFVIFCGAATGLFILVIAGVFAGKRARLGGIVLGALLLFDLGRADLPWIIHWDYTQKYASNPIVDFLKDKPYENRVAYGLPRPLSTPDQFQWFDQLYHIEWAQHHFPYYNIQSLDVVQMSRMPADLAAFDGTFQIALKTNASGQLEIVPETFPRVGRLWELTSTRYLLGPASLLDLYNQQFDPEQHSFRILQRFDIVPKPGIERPTKLEELTAVTSPNGAYALFEFTGTLPRVKLYSHWQVSTNDEATLKTLGDKQFDPQQTVLVATPLPVAMSTNQNAGTVEFKSYKPSDIIFDTKSEAPSVLLLNDKYDPNWRVTIDGKPAELLRCNFIMRGVYLPVGPHTVEFKFRLPTGPLKITLSAIAASFVLIGLLVFFNRRKPAA